MWDKQVPCCLLSPAYPLWRHVTSRCPTPQQGSNCSAALAALAALAAQRAQHLQRNERKCRRAAIAAKRAQHLQRDERSTCSATSAALAGQRNKRSTCGAAQQAQHLVALHLDALRSRTAPPMCHGGPHPPAYIDTDCTRRDCRDTERERHREARCCLWRPPARCSVPRGAEVAMSGILSRPRRREGVRHLLSPSLASPWTPVMGPIQVGDAKECR
jgi:hypothetical protein